MNLEIRMMLKRGYIILIAGGVSLRDEVRVLKELLGKASLLLSFDLDD